MITRRDNESGRTIQEGTGKEGHALIILKPRTRYEKLIKRAIAELRIWQNATRHVDTRRTQK